VNKVASRNPRKQSPKKQRASRSSQTGVGQLDAAALARRYRILLVPDEDTGFLGYIAELPGVMADGRSAEQCVTATQFAAQLVVETMLEEGKVPPLPGGQAKRDHQVNVRFTGEEKTAIELAKTRKDYGDVSSFIREVVLDTCKHLGTLIR